MELFCCSCPLTEVSTTELRAVLGQIDLDRDGKVGRADFLCWIDGAPRDALLNSHCESANVIITTNSRSSYCQNRRRRLVPPEAGGGGQAGGTPGSQPIAKRCPNLLAPSPVSDRSAETRV